MLMVCWQGQFIQGANTSPLPHTGEITQGTGTFPATCPCLAFPSLKLFQFTQGPKTAFSLCTSQTSLAAVPG